MGKKIILYLIFVVLLTSLCFGYDGVLTTFANGTKFNLSFGGNENITVHTDIQKYVSVKNITLQIKAYNMNYGESTWNWSFVRYYSIDSPGAAAYASVFDNERKLMFFGTDTSLYVFNVSVINNPVQIQKITISDQPYSTDNIGAMVFDSDRKILIVNCFDDSELYFLNTTNPYNLINISHYNNTIGTSGYSIQSSEGMAYDSFHKYLYVASYHDNQISLFNVSDYYNIKNVSYFIDTSNVYSAEGVTKIFYDNITQYIHYASTIDNSYSIKNMTKCYGGTCGGAGIDIYSYTSTSLPYDMQNYTSIYVSGNYSYVTTEVNSLMIIFNLTPTLAVFGPVGSIDYDKTGPVPFSLDTVYNSYIDETTQLGYFSSFVDNGITVINISDKRNPTNYSWISPVSPHVLTDISTFYVDNTIKAIYAPVEDIFVLLNYASVPFSRFPTNTYLEYVNIGYTPKEFNYSGTYTISNNYSTNITKFNTALPSCSCSRCTDLGDYCRIGWMFHSDTNGTLEISNLNISYDFDGFRVFAKNVTSTRNMSFFNCSINNIQYRGQNGVCISNLTYNMTKNVTLMANTYFNMTSNNVSTNVNLTITMFQANITLQFKDLRTSNPITTSVDVHQFGILNFTVTSGSYLLQTFNGYNNFSAVTSYYNTTYFNFTFTSLDKNTYIVYFASTLTLNLFDEQTGRPFNINGNVSITQEIYCNAQTITNLINSTSTTFSAPCEFSKTRYFLDFGATGSYYRTIFFIEENDYVNVYLADLRNTTVIFDNFILDDLLTNYINPLVYIKKIINTSNVIITSDYVDFEKKISAYLIPNTEYSLEVYSDNQPVRVLGSYFANTASSITIRLYSIGVAPVPSGFSNYVTMAVGDIDNSTGTPKVIGTYYDTSNLTSSVTWSLFQNGTLIYSLTIPNQNDIEFTYPYSGLENDSLTAILNVTYGSYTFAYGRQIQAEAPPATEIENLKTVVSPDLLNWIITLFISVVALSFTIRSSSMGAIVVCGLAAFFIFFKLFVVTWALLGVAFVIAVASFLKEKSLES